MMRKKIVKFYMYIRILVGVVFISYRKKVLINMLIKVCFFFMEMSNCFVKVISGMIEIGINYSNLYLKI